MTQALAEAMRRQGQMAGYGESNARIGTISSYDPTTHAVKVLIQPEAIESNWLPLGAIAIGDSFGIAVGPQIGDQVKVVFQEGDFNSGVVVARLFSTAQPAMPVPSGEMWVIHSTGSHLKFTNDGRVSLVANLELDVSAPTINVSATGNVNISAAALDLTGQLNVTGNTTFTGTVKANGHAIDDTHEHSGVQTGGGNTGRPL